MHCTEVGSSRKIGSSCCEKDSVDNHWQGMVEKICRVALAAVALAFDPVTFLISASIGIGIGIGYTFYKLSKGEVIDQGISRPNCGPGFFNFLGGIDPSPVCSALITSVFIGIHMEHSSSLVAFCSLPLGMYFGNQIALGAWNLKTRLEKWQNSEH